MTIRRARLLAARKKGIHTKIEWENLKKEFDYKCVRCGNKPEKLEKDHIIPIYQGGNDTTINIQPLCKKCNCQKGPETINWVLIRRKNTT